jgi:arabinofuranosyltransferase
VTATARDHILIGFFLTLFTVVLLKSAWVCDDAFITFRTVDNFVHGYGLRWNIAERVQSYTHPLWMGAHAAVYALVRVDLFWITLALSVGCSLAAVAIYAYGIAPSALNATLGVAILTFSKAFLEYSTSGLENPLSHLLVVVFFLVCFNRPATPRTLFTLALIAALATLNRMDTLLIFLPTLAYLVYLLRRQMWLPALLAGFLPFILWELFSLLYYGFLFPNTAYAKLNTGIPAAELAHQGWYYLLDSLIRDPLTLLVIGASVVLLLLARGWRYLAIAAGMLLYLLYVVSIGGDFMSGRFLSVPLLCAVIIISCYDLSLVKTAWVWPFLVIFLVRFHSDPLIPKPLHNREISDERRVFYEDNSLMGTDRTTRMPTHPWGQDGLKERDYAAPVEVRGAVGMYGYYLGPGTHIVDYNGLNDALLARLPAKWEYNWKAGHFVRIIPDGYIETLETGRNAIRDGQLADYYDKLALVVRGDLFDRRRLAEIWRINTGWYDSLIAFDDYRYPGMRHVTLPEQNQRPEPERIPNGVDVAFEQVRHNQYIEVGLSRGVEYRIFYQREGATIARQTIPPRYYVLNPVSPHVVAVPPAVARRGYDAIRLFPTTADKAALWHVYPLESAAPVSNRAYFDQGWRELESDAPYGRAPATLSVHTTRPQSATLSITPAAIGDDRSPDASATLQVEQEGEPVTTIPITNGQESSATLHLAAGENHIGLRVGTSTFTIESLSIVFEEAWRDE